MTYKKSKKLFKKLVRLVTFLLALLGGYTYYHFFIQDTGVNILQENGQKGKKLSRAYLLDLVEKDALARGKK